MAERGRADLDAISLVQGDAVCLKHAGWIRLQCLWGQVRNLLGERVFETMIPRSTKLAEAPSFGKPIIHYDKYSASAAAYEVLAQEFLTRLNLPSPAGEILNPHPA